MKYDMITSVIDINSILSKKRVFLVCHNLTY